MAKKKTTTDDDDELFMDIALIFDPDEAANEAKRYRLGGPKPKYGSRADFVRDVNEWVRRRKMSMGYAVVGGKMTKVPQPKPLQKASLCNHLGISLRTLERWQKDPEHELYDLCEQVNTMIEADLWDASGSDVPMAKLNLQSNYGHRARTDVTSDDKRLPGSIDPTQLDNEELKLVVRALEKAHVSGE